MRTRKETSNLFEHSMSSASHQQSHHFVYPDHDDDQSQPETAAVIREEVLRRVGIFINEMVIRKTDGVSPSAMTIAVRLVILNALLYPDQFRSLNEYAKQLGCSRAWLSAVAGSFLASIGMKASWQRLKARDVYAERARGVHAGTWKASDKWERRKLRLPKDGGKNCRIENRRKEIRHPGVKESFTNVHLT